MQNLVYEWVSNLRKFCKNQVILLKIWPQIGSIGIWMGHFFLKNWYLHASTFKFCGGTSLPKPNFNTPRAKNQEKVEKIGLKLGTSGENWPKSGKRGKNQKRKEKIVKFLSPCPCRQAGLATLLALTVHYSLNSLILLISPRLKTASPIEYVGFCGIYYKLSANSGCASTGGGEGASSRAQGVLKFGFGKDAPLWNLKIDPYKYHFPRQNDSFIYQILHFIRGHLYTKTELILLPMLAAHSRRAFCTEYPLPPGSRGSSSEQLFKKREVGDIKNTRLCDGVGNEWNRGISRGGGAGGLSPPVRSPAPLSPPWNDTLYRGLWRTTIFSPGQPHSAPLPAPAFWKVWLRPWSGILDLGLFLTL